MKSSEIIKDLLAALRAEKLELARQLAREAPDKEHDVLFSRSLLALLEGDFVSEDIKRFNELFPDSPFLAYIHAYLHLRNNDEEKALYLYTRLVDVPEGWLARELIEKSKKNQLVDLAQTNSPLFFVPLPESKKKLLSHRIFLARPEFLQRGDKETVEPGHSFQEKKQVLINFLRSKYGRGLLWFTLIFLLLGITWQLVFVFFTDKEEPSWRYLTLDEAAHILPAAQVTGQYQYVAREQLLEDFRQARSLMAEGKINQARYLLQRMILSNADFRSREKARLFLNFIPVPEYESFSDNVPAADLFQEPQYRTGSYLVWEGEMKNWKKEVGGYRGTMVITEKEQNYLVEIFWPLAGVVPGNKPEDFYEERQQMVRRAIVFGQFKGLVGNQKVIYLEAIRVWF